MDSIIIQALKTNKEPFGLMSAEKQVKAKEIGVSSFLVYQALTWIDQFKASLKSQFTTSNAYRLRPDYEEKPEIVECEVIKDYSGDLSVRLDEGDPWPLTACPNHPGFIGFEWDGILWGRPYKCKDTGEVFTKIRKDCLRFYEVCDMAEAKVLFRKDK